jgi:uncharacterized protein (TIRG00374 family)
VTAWYGPRVASIVKPLDRMSISNPVPSEAVGADTQPAPAMTAARTRKLLRPLTFALGAIMLAYLINRFGTAKVWADLRLIGWRLLAIVALEGLVNWSSAGVWWHTLPREARRGWFARVFLVHLAGGALNQSSPGAPLGGEPLKVMYLKQRFSVSALTASLLSAKLAQALARALFVILGILMAWRTLKFESLPVKSLTAGFILITVGILAFMTMQVRGFSAATKIVSTRFHFLGEWVWRLERGLERVDEHLRELYTKRPWDFVAALALSLAGLCVGVIQVWLLMNWMGLGQSWLTSLTIEALSVLVGFVLFAIPGSLGVQEGGKVLIFAALGLPMSAGLSIGVAFRLNSLINLAQGLVTLMWLSPSAGRSRTWIAQPAAQEPD